MNKLLYIICFFLILSCDQKDDHELDINYQYEEENSKEKDIYYLIVNNYTPYTCYVECDVRVSTKNKSFQISYKNYPYTYSYDEKVPGNQGEKYIINIKDPDFPECEKKKVFYVSVKNNEQYTYKICTERGSLISNISPNETRTITLSAGEHILEFEQAEGHTFPPTVYFKIVSGNSCDNKNISIP